MSFVIYEDISWRLKLSDDKDEMILLFIDPTIIENQVLQEEILRDFRIIFTH